MSEIPGQTSVYDALPMEFVLKVPCLACNREPGERLCVLCSLIEEAERKVGNDSPEVTVVLK